MTAAAPPQWVGDGHQVHIVDLRQGIQRDEVVVDRVVRSSSLPPVKSTGPGIVQHIVGGSGLERLDQLQLDQVIAIVHQAEEVRGELCPGKVRVGGRRRLGDGQVEIFRLDFSGFAGPG
jgi:hypothetical protein